MPILVSSTERGLIATLGPSSSTPEAFGVDLLWKCPGGLCGVQRKEVVDLLASIQDHRLGKETMQATRLSTRVLLVEGRIPWTQDGKWGGAYPQRWTRAALRKALWSLGAQGWTVDWTDNAADTVAWVEAFYAWTQDGKHRTGKVRAKPSGKWGNLSDPEYQAWWIQALDGISYELAGRIVKELGFPFELKVTEDDLRRVEGIGKVRARRIVELFGG